MARKTKEKREQGEGKEERFLVFRVKRGRETEVYIVSPSALGRPVKNRNLDRLIDEYKRRAPFRDDEKLEVDFALLVSAADALFRVCSQNVPPSPKLDLND